MKKIIIFIIFTFTLIINIALVLFWNTEIVEKDNKAESIEAFSDTSSLCKVSEVILIEQLDNNKSKEFDDILSSLSTFDISLVKQEINTCDQEQIIKAFKKLKRRLSENEYKRIEKILSPFIDIEKLDNII